MRIERDTSELLNKIQAAKPVKKTPKVPEKKTEVDPYAPNVGREAAKLRARAKAAETERDAIKEELIALKAETDPLRNHARLWKEYEHVERQKLLATLPAELKADAKTMPLNHLRLFTKQQVPADKPKPGEVTDKMDISELQKKGDTKAINDYVEKVKNGEITPVAPKETV